MVGLIRDIKAQGWSYRRDIKHKRHMVGLIRDIKAQGWSYRRDIKGTWLTYIVTTYLIVCMYVCHGNVYEGNVISL